LTGYTELHGSGGDRTQILEGIMSSPEESYQGIALRGWLWKTMAQSEMSC
jgi:hypothetical protein